MIKTILLAIDLSSCTSQLLSYAANLANEYHAELVVLHAVEPIGDVGLALLKAYLKTEKTGQIAAEGLDTIVAEVKAQIIDNLTEEHMSGDVALDCLKRVEVVNGHPEEVILTMAEKVHADLVILGNHAPGSAMMTGLGTVAHKVLHNSRVPVFLVPVMPGLLPENGSQPQMPLW